MKNQYLLLAETIIYKNNKLTALNIYDQFLAMELPASFVFDLAVLCGPGWDAGDHSIDIYVKIEEEQEAKLGSIDMNIPNEDFVYNAIASNLSLTIAPNVNKITFVVKSKDETIIQRDFLVNQLTAKEPA